MPTEFFNNLIRNQVSQTRIRYKDDQYDLDLSYITPKIMAMSFPAEAFVQKLYRNNIEVVAKFLEEKHAGNYRIYNLTGKDYNMTPFKKKVVTYQWEDHHSPTLYLLAQCCQDIHDFLEENRNNVIIVHCNAGKGRTGTLIACYLMFCGFCDTARDALAYYGYKRFTNGVGVENPSQRKYVYYFKELLKGNITIPRNVRLKSVNIQHFAKKIFQKNNAKVILEVRDAANNDKHFEKSAQAKANIDFQMPDTEIHGDLFFRLMHNDKGILRWGINTSMFLPLTGAKTYTESFDVYTIDPYQIVKDKEYANLSVVCHFVPACKDSQCQNLSNQSICKTCKQSISAGELNQWEAIRKVVKARLDRAPDLQSGFIQMFSARARSSQQDSNDLIELLQKDIDNGYLKGLRQYMGDIPIGQKMYDIKNKLNTLINKKALKKWTTEDVRFWMDYKVEFQDYGYVVSELKVTGADIYDLTEQDMIEKLDIKTLLRQKLRDEITYVKEAQKLSIQGACCTIF